MTVFLHTLWTITWGSWLTAAVIVVLRLLFRRVLSAKAKYYLWLLLALRLCLPVLPQSPTSLFNLLPKDLSEPQTALTVPAVPAVPAAPDLPQVSDAAYDTASAPMADVSVTQVPVAPTLPPAAEDPESPAAPTVSMQTILFWVWLGGCAAVLLIYGVLYGLTALRLRRMLLCSDSDTLRVFLGLKRQLGFHRQVRLVSGSGGMSGGLIHPTIVLPAECFGDAAAPILLHEMKHIQAGDLWLLAFYRLLCAANWFNPVVWLCFHRAYFDSEAACDQRVLETGLVDKASYAETIYREGTLSARNGLYFRMAFGGKKHALRDRIRQISRYRGKKLWMLPLMLVLAIIVTACTLTGASSGSGDSEGSTGTGNSDYANYFRDNTEYSGHSTQICYAETPYAESRNFEQDYLLSVGAIPEMPEYNECNGWANYYEDGSFFDIGVIWQYYDEDDSTYKQLILTMIPGEVGDTDMRDGFFQPNEDQLTVTEVDEVTVYGSGTAEPMKIGNRLSQCNVLVFTKDDVRYQIECIQDSTLEELGRVLDFYLTDGVNLDDFAMEYGSVNAASEQSSYNPLTVENGVLTFAGTQWGMSREAVIEVLDLEEGQYSLNSKGQNYYLTLENPLPLHPEVLQIEFDFHFSNLDLNLGLDGAEIRYEREQISYETLLEQCTAILGSPTSKSEDGNSSSWDAFDSAGLSLTDGNLYVRLRFYADQRTSDEEVLAGFDMETYMASLQPPNGHYGWTFQKHVENGLLDPDNGEFGLTESGEQFVTTIELGGMETQAIYYFTPSILTAGTGVYVLREVHVALPEQVVLSQWIASFSDSFTDKMYERSNLDYCTPLRVAAFLTEAQKETINQAFYMVTGSGGSTEGWPLATNWYDPAGRLWKYNGTGYALYLDAMALS